MQAAKKPVSFEKNAVQTKAEHSSNRLKESAKGFRAVAGGSVCPFDVRLLMDRVEGNPELLPNLVRSLSVQWRELLIKMNTAVKRRNGDTLVSSAHRLMLSFESIGHRSARRHAKALQEMVQNPRWEGAEATVSTLKRETDQLLLALETYLTAAVSAA